MKAEFKGIRAVLLDIEGTTTPIDFVFKTLFPYAREHVYSFILKNFTDPKVDSVLKKLQVSFQQNKTIEKKPIVWDGISIESVCNSASQYVNWLISIDSKDTAMKELQGLIWEEGYKSGQLHGEVYAEVPKVMETLHRANITLAIYSSGSTLAQKLIFGSTAYGDLTQFINDFFDTGVGNKRDPESYLHISKLLDIPAQEILFLSDIIEEVNAARASNLKSIQVVREGHNTAKDTENKTITTLLDLLP